jgi:hypothetical protein
VSTAQHTCFTVKCDDCKNDYTNCEYVTMHYDSAEEAVQTAIEYDWIQLPDRLICDSCAYAAEKSGAIAVDDDGDWQNVAPVAASTTGAGEKADA